MLNKHSRQVLLQGQVTIYRWTRENILKSGDNIRTNVIFELYLGIWWNLQNLVFLYTFFFFFRMGEVKTYDLIACLINLPLTCSWSSFFTIHLCYSGFWILGSVCRAGCLPNLIVEGWGGWGGGVDLTYLNYTVDTRVYQDAPTSEHFIPVSL